jgi:hypothetical protein
MRTGKAEPRAVGGGAAAAARETGTATPAAGQQRR